MFFWCKIQLVIKTTFYIIDILIIADYNNSTETEFKKILLQQFKDNNEYKKYKYVNYRLQTYTWLHFLTSSLLCYVYTVTAVHTLNTTTTEVTAKM